MFVKCSMNLNFNLTIKLKSLNANGSQPDRTIIFQSAYLQLRVPVKMSK